MKELTSLCCFVGLDTVFQIPKTIDILKVKQKAILELEFTLNADQDLFA